MIDPELRSYLFKDNPEEEVKSWIARLRFFRFVRGHGTHAATADHLGVKLRYRSPEELLHICGVLGVSLVPFDPRRSPIAGRGYTHEEWEQLQEEIGDAPGWAQPTAQRIAGGGARAGLCADYGELFISLSSSNEVWGVEERDVENALRIETLLEAVRDSIEDPPEDNKFCICPKYYPEFWASS